MAADDTIDQKVSKPAEASHHLKPITINRRRFADADKILYRVYSAPGEFKLVEANSAHEAFEKSEIARPHKIERELFYRYLALSPNQIEADTGDSVDTDVNLPDADEMKTLLFAALDDGSLKPSAEEAFTGLSINQLNGKGFEEDEAAALAQAEAAAQAAVEKQAAAQAIEQAVEAEPEAIAQADVSVEDVQQAAPAEDAPAQEDEELTPEQVEALLNGED